MKPSNSPPSWKLAAPAAKTQGLVVSGFGWLCTGRALFVQLSRPGGAWLRDLPRTAEITNAVPPPETPERAAAIAFTYTGLKKMGLADNALASFSRAFREGMMQEDRLRRLGDRRDGKWLETVAEGGPQWSGNSRSPDAASAVESEAFRVDDPAPAEELVTTPLTVHALVMLYTSSEQAAEDWCSEVHKVLEAHDAKVVRTLPLVLDPNHLDISNEHFGFADGLSQPTPYDEGGAVTLDGAPAPRDRVQGVPLGEFLFGYVNGHREPAPGPVVPDDATNRPTAAGLEPHPTAEGFFDLGLNGTYLVARELKQDVAAFWNSMHANAARIREQDPEYGSDVTADWLAERVVGRNRKGHLLCTPGGTYRSPDANGRPDNSFLFETDPHGIGCPPGSHVRRANPRDALSPVPTASARKTALAAANNHRILRRGRKFGPVIKNEREDDGEDRGLLFMCLNTDIPRQFEFVQQTWLLNSNFATLLDEVDPLIGPAGRMTIREEPLRRTVKVDTFVKMVGGEYFFLPSMPALSYLKLL